MIILELLLVVFVDYISDRNAGNAVRAVKELRLGDLALGATQSFWKAEENLNVTHKSKPQENRQTSIVALPCKCFLVAGGSTFRRGTLCFPCPVSSSLGYLFVSRQFAGMPL